MVFIKSVNIIGTQSAEPEIIKSMAELRSGGGGQFHVNRDRRDPEGTVAYLRGGHWAISTSPAGNVYIYYIYGGHAPKRISKYATDRRGSRGSGTPALSTESYYGN